jgi:endonuclease/exonuclease/phosphatase family metal-dependent hydrolase
MWSTSWRRWQRPEAVHDIGVGEWGVRLRVVGWNLDGFTGLEDKVELLAGLAWDVCLLQEVTEASWPHLRALADEAVWSGDHLPELISAPRYRSAVLVRGDWFVHDLGPVPQVPSPERTATAKLERDGDRLVVASLALPPGVAWGDAGKGRQADRIACWLRACPMPVVVGIDANTPKWDRPELADCEWWNDQEPQLFGVDRIHDLRDVYREVLDADPQRRAEVLAEHPDGPLAVSHLRGRGGQRTACRYDHVLASPELAVRDVRYLWDEAVAAGSDHALIVASLDLRTDGRVTPRS